jgi:hypothetical protein
MYLTYTPEGTDEPKRWKYDFRRLATMEREAIERHTGLVYVEFTQQVIKGSSLCRRALLFTFLRREHKGVRWEDVTFEWDELKLEYSRGELEQMRQDLIDSGQLHGGELAAALEQLDKQIAEAFEDPDDTGKALRPIAD